MLLLNRVRAPGKGPAPEPADEPADETGPAV
jgi:hypothetical protein